MISPVSPLNFKGKYYVQVPKSAFGTPNNLPVCETNFESALSDALYEGKSVKEIKKTPFFSFLEAPMYADILNSTIYSLKWVRAHSGVDVKSPKDEDYQTFLLLTKKEADKFYKATKSRKLRAIERRIDKEADKRLEEGRGVGETWQYAAMYKEFNKITDDIMENEEPKETIVINNLDEIPSIIDKIEV